MANQLPLDTLLRLSSEKFDACAKYLSAQNTASAAAQRHYSLLQEYRYDYLLRLQRSMGSGMVGSDCQNYQGFMGTLDSAIIQQSRVCSQTAQNLADARAALQQAHQRRGAYEALIERDQRARNAASSRREQRLNDEFSSRRHFTLATA